MTANLNLKTRNPERVERIKKMLSEAQLDALVCTLPTNVLLLSGYWPVVGTAVAVATQDGKIAVLAPDDEKDLAEKSWASSLQTYASGSLHSMDGNSETVKQPLAQLLQSLGVAQGRVGYEGLNFFEPASYASMYLYNQTLPEILRQILPKAQLSEALPQLQQLRSVLTPFEQNQMRTACEVAGFAFQLGADQIRVGLREPEVAAAFEGQFSIQGIGYKEVARAGGFAFCMSGPNSALAGAAYARTRNRQLEAGDLVLVHVNSFVDGYWTDITRTYCLGEPTRQQREMYDAIAVARAAAIQAIRPGVAAKEVDAAARDVLNERGFGQYFTHGLGHNVGFAAISAFGPPRLHPASPDTLEVGMTFNVEPSIYIHGYGGMRHCDVVTITENDVEILTPFQSDVERMIIR